ECLQQSHNCGLGFECVNTEGSFRCNSKPGCSVGFNLDAQANCVTDECDVPTQPCSPSFNCINTVGSYMCQRKIICSRGYHASPDGSRCIVDECQGGQHRCGEGQLCHNMPGSYRCECLTGYQYDSFRRMCIDVNECWRYPGRLCAQTCENTPGSYECSCTSGFRLSSDGKNVNECLASPCSQECANIYGSYQCYCRQGYHLTQDGHTCEIDECSRSISHLCTYKCVNVPGSYQCKCPEYGYTMSPNGRSCRIDECTTGAHNCSLAETCYNIQGSYRCLSLNCPPNYRKLSQLPGLSKLSPENHLLLPELPVQHRHPCSDLPHRTVPRIRGRQRHCEHHARKRGKLLQHAEAEHLHGRRVPASTGPRAEGFPDHRGDEALETGDVYHFPGQDLRLHHR
uniref:EGF-like domain-containing protein n=1 Tax=Mola mola TaxID=94237 RepID=A0A3Q3XHD3_MOLML